MATQIASTPVVKGEAAAAIYKDHRVSFYESIGFVQNLIQPVNLPYDSPVIMRMSLDLYLEKIAQKQ